MRDFKHTMDVLVKAYFNNTLEHTNCYACAVGNIVAEANCYDMNTVSSDSRFPRNFTFWVQEKRFDWFHQITGRSAKDLQNVVPCQQIANTGYSVAEVRRIEKAFESASFGENDDDWMFNGLMAVLEVLADIHGTDFNGRSVYEKRLQEIFATK